MFMLKANNDRISLEIVAIEARRVCDRDHHSDPSIIAMSWIWLIGTRGHSYAPPPHLNLSSLRATEELDVSKTLMMYQPSGRNTHSNLLFKLRYFKKEQLCSRAFITSVSLQAKTIE